MKVCPKCSNILFEERKNGIKVDACNKCHWIFLEFSELKHFIDSVNESDKEVKIAEVDKWDFRKDHIGKVYCCAHCQSDMNEREFNYGSGIHIDFCRWCWATFLWEWELQEILDHEYTRLHSREAIALAKKLEYEWNIASKKQEVEISWLIKWEKTWMLYRMIGKYFG